MVDPEAPGRGARGCVSLTISLRGSDPQRGARPIGLRRGQCAIGHRSLVAGLLARSRGVVFLSWVRSHYGASLSKPKLTKLIIVFEKHEVHVGCCNQYVVIELSPI